MKDLDAHVADRLLAISQNAGRDATRSPDSRRKIVLAFSGGGDSSALLNALVSPSLKEEFAILAAHVNHGLQEQASGWAAHCELVAAKYGVAVKTHTLTSSPNQGESSEAWARRERYDWFTTLMDEGDMLVTAHHQDDQLETFFLQLIRGAGPHGLRGIRESQSFGPGYLVRPMLAINQADIVDYLNYYNVPHVDDPSNKNRDFDRNYLRLEIIPALRERWPHIAANVAHASAIQQQLADDLDSRADVLLEEHLRSDGALPLSALSGAPFDHRFSVFRRWCELKNLGVLERHHYSEIEKSVFGQNPKTTLEIQWKNASLRYFHGALFLAEREGEFDDDASYEWDMTGNLNLPNGELAVMEIAGGGIDRKYRGGSIRVGYYRRAGERCHPAQRGHSQTLKKLFQFWKVPPWLRNQVPIVWIDGEIAAVVPFCVCRKFVAETAEGSLGFEFRKNS